MYIKDKLKELFPRGEVNIFVDMDGVITDYNFGSSLDFKNKRPLFTNINNLRRLNREKNINLYILSICKTRNDINDKNTWLDKYAPFFKFNRRYIIPKSEYPHLSSKELKLNFLIDIINDLNLKNVCLIDDDNGILKYIKDSNLDIKLFQDSSIIE